MDEIPIDMKMKNEIESLENRLRCYHEGKYGRSTIKMHVELKKIDRIKELLEQRQEARPHETLVIGMSGEVVKMGEMYVDDEKIIGVFVLCDKEEFTKQTVNFLYMDVNITPKDQ